MLKRYIINNKERLYISKLICSTKDKCCIYSINKCRIIIDKSSYVC